MSEFYQVDGTKHWVQTRSGRAVDLIDTKPDQIFADDLAVQLARIPRWNAATIGHPNLIYPIASHSVLVMRLLPDGSPAALRLAALLHDGAEAYTGDRPSPVKWACRALAGPGSVDPYKIISDHIQEAIHDAVGLPFDDAWHAAIKHADMLALALEDKAFMAPHPRPWIELPDTTYCRFNPMMVTPFSASLEFKYYLRQYMRDAGCMPHAGFWS